MVEQQCQGCLSGTRRSCHTLYDSWNWKVPPHWLWEGGWRFPPEIFDPKCKHQAGMSHVQIHSLCKHNMLPSCARYVHFPKAAHSAPFPRDGGCLRWLSSNAKGASLEPTSGTILPIIARDLALGNSWRPLKSFIHCSGASVAQVSSASSEDIIELVELQL